MYTKEKMTKISQRKKETPPFRCIRYPHLPGGSTPLSSGLTPPKLCVGIWYNHPHILSTANAYIMTHWGVEGAEKGVLTLHETFHSGTLIRSSNTIGNVFPVYFKAVSKPQKLFFIHTAKLENHSAPQAVFLTLSG